MDALMRPKLDVHLVTYYCVFKLVGHVYVAWALVGALAHKAQNFFLFSLRGQFWRLVTWLLEQAQASYCSFFDVCVGAKFPLFKRVVNLWSLFKLAAVVNIFSFSGQCLAAEACGNWIGELPINRRLLRFHRVSWLALLAIELDQLLATEALIFH